MTKKSPKSVAKPKHPQAYNRKATFDVAVEQTLEAGIILTGDEIKSIRANRSQMTGSYVKFLAGKPVLIGLHLSLAQDPERTRALLLHKKEIASLSKDLAVKGRVAVPIELYIKHGWAKVKLGIGSGRKQYDKRELLKKRDQSREQEQYLKQRSGVV